MRIRAASTAVLLLAVATACSSASTTTSVPPPSPTAAAPQQSSAPSAPAAAQQSSAAPGAGAGGLPPKPDAATTAAYIAALDAIDPDIVHGKPDTAVSRGRDQCSSISQHKTPDELTKLVIQRFSSPTHPQGFGPEKAGKILEVVHTHICPTF